MSNHEIGRIVAIDANGIIRVELSLSISLTPGTRLGVMQSDGTVSVGLKVIQSDAAGTFARQFEDFVSTDQLRRAVGAGVGAAIGSLVEPVFGSMLGAVVGSALAQRRNMRSIKVGQPVLQLTPEISA